MIIDRVDISESRRGLHVHNPEDVLSVLRALGQQRGERMDIVTDLASVAEATAANSRAMRTRRPDWAAAFMHNLIGQRHEPFADLSICVYWRAEKYVLEITDPDGCRGTEEALARMFGLERILENIVVTCRVPPNHPDALMVELDFGMILGVLQHAGIAAPPAEAVVVDLTTRAAASAGLVPVALPELRIVGSPRYRAALKMWGPAAPVGPDQAPLWRTGVVSISGLRPGGDPKQYGDVGFAVELSRQDADTADALLVAQAKRLADAYASMR